VVAVSLITKIKIYNNRLFSKSLGKSTCMSLLLRYYEPSSGKITVNGRSISEYNVEQLRQNIGVVSQEPVCFFHFFPIEFCHSFYLIQPSMKTFVLVIEVQQGMKLNKQHEKPMHMILSCNCQKLDTIKHLFQYLLFFYVEI
jgi:ABC-type oligopeptide transport system ATPase subunit